ncbi:hypothetical protein CYFUS_006807 [Cystobacter fuscus]|uniref:Uncharacterized protein n=1 Tax=Cystobacter fuscus TaxID=43 RepID=A0A250JCY9_9BACT|nr:DUF5953 family protein [Cystobacter fuscus]ATB41342.1 hypothetical protein CYFUS_006807 [Cystobacter fuscus]
MTAKQKITLIVYAPALVGDDSRPVAVVHGMERAFPGLRLGWRISEQGHFIPLPQRDAAVALERPDGGFPLISNDNESALVTVTGLETSAVSSSGGQAQLEVHARLPLTPEGIAAAADVLEAVAEAARAYWGHATPSRAGLDIARQTKNWAANPQPPPRGLPALKLAWDIPSPEIPHRLGWLNYWSAAAARAIGFPDPARDAELLSRARRTATGGRVVQLTDAPLDLDNPAHLDALKRAYERFPEIGGRSAP